MATLLPPFWLIRAAVALNSSKAKKKPAKNSA